MKSREIIGGIKKGKKCCYCGRWSHHEAMRSTIYGGGGKHGVGNIHSCIGVTDCLERMREASDRKGTPKTKQFIVDLNSFRVAAINYDEAIAEAGRMLKGNTFVPVIEGIEMTD